MNVKNKGLSNPDKWFYKKFLEFKKVMDTPKVRKRWEEDQKQFRKDMDEKYGKGMW